MATLTLTDTPQELTGSSSGAIVDSDSPFMFGFGATEPTDGAKCENYKEVLNYSGGFGSMWVWKLGQNSQTIYYTVAV